MPAWRAQLDRVDDIRIIVQAGEQLQFLRVSRLHPQAQAVDSQSRASRAGNPRFTVPGLASRESSNGRLEWKTPAAVVEYAPDLSERQQAGRSSAEEECVCTGAARCGWPATSSISRHSASV